MDQTQETVQRADAAELDRLSREYRDLCDEIDVLEQERDVVLAQINNLEAALGFQ